MTTTPLTVGDLKRILASVPDHYALAVGTERQGPGTIEVTCVIRATGRQGIILQSEPASEVIATTVKTTNHLIP